MVYDKTYNDSTDISKQNRKGKHSPAFALLLSISLQMPGMNHADVFHPFPYIPDDNLWQQVSVVYF